MNGKGGEGGREGGREGRGAVCQRKNKSRPFLSTISPRKEPALLSSSSYGPKGVWGMSPRVLRRGSTGGLGETIIPSSFTERVHRGSGGNHYCLSVSLCFSPTAILLRNFLKVVTCSKFTVLVSHVCLSFPYIFLDVYIGMCVCRLFPRDPVLLC